MAAAGRAVAGRRRPRRPVPVRPRALAVAVRPTVLGRPPASAAGLVVDAPPVRPRRGGRSARGVRCGSPAADGRPPRRDGRPAVRPAPGLLRLRQIAAGVLAFVFAAALVLGLGLLADAVGAARDAGSAPSAPVTGPLAPGVGEASDAVAGVPGAG